MLQLSILVLSERLHLCVLYYRSILLPSNIVPIGGIGEDALHLAIDNTKTLLKITYLFPFFWLGLTRMVGTTNIHLVRTLDTLITIEDCWSDYFLEIRRRWGQRNCWSYPFYLVSRHSILVKALAQEGWLEIFCKNTSPAQFIMRMF